MSKEKIELSCLCWYCMAKCHVKERPPVKTVLHPINVKAVFLNLKNNKDKNKNKADTTRKDQ